MGLGRKRWTDPVQRSPGRLLLHHCLHSRPLLQILVANYPKEGIDGIRIKRGRPGGTEAEYAFVGCVWRTEKHVPNLAVHRLDSA